MARTRVPPQALTKVNVERLIKKDAEADKAKRAAKAQERKQTKATKSAPASTPAIDPAAVATKQQAEREAALKTMAEDYGVFKAEWVGESGVPCPSFDEWMASQGYNPDGSVRVQDKATYQGSMLALVTARKHYVKAANGILCNGDLLATALGGLNRAQVIDVLVRALGLGSNPYTALNPGQQSMNLRNRARVSVRKGTLKLEDIVSAVEKESRRPA